MCTLKLKSTEKIRATVTCAISLDPLCFQNFQHRLSQKAKCLEKAVQVNLS